MNREQIKIGQPVIYWAVIDESGKRSDPMRTFITSEVWELGHGEAVCNVHNVSGCVAITHLDRVSPGSLMAARMSGLVEVTDADFKAETEKFFSDRGVKIDFK